MLAIIIPYFKLAFFDATLESLAVQTDKRFKTYIGDDASSEALTDLLEKYKGKFDFVYHRFEQNLGGISLVQQWERCIALSGGEQWIMILGDDDVLGKNVVKSFYENLVEIEEEKIAVVRFSTSKIDKFGNSVSTIYRHPKVENSVKFLFNKTRSSLSEYVFRKSQVLEIRFKNFPLAWFSDVLAVLEFSNFKNIFSINAAVVYIRISELSISGSPLNEKLKLKAKFDFYYYLLTQHFQYFIVLERKELFFRLNKCYLNNKIDLAMFFKISKLYLAKKLYKEYFLFIWQAISTYKIKS
jgi:glycosyltransferase involved in cell wall biosynthesis